MVYFLSVSRTSLATFHEGKHNISHMSMDVARGLMVTCGTDRVVKVTRSLSQLAPCCRMLHCHAVNVCEALLVQSRFPVGRLTFPFHKQLANSQLETPRGGEFLRPQRRLIPMASPSVALVRAWHPSITLHAVPAPGFSLPLPGLSWPLSLVTPSLANASFLLGRRLPTWKK